MGNPIQGTSLFALTLLLGVWGLSSVLTLISGIASRSVNSTTLMAILSFPVLIPLLLMIIRLTGYAIDGQDWNFAGGKIVILAALNVIAVTMSYILFPYLWKN